MFADLFIFFNFFFFNGFVIVPNALLLRARACARPLLLVYAHVFATERYVLYVGRKQRARVVHVETSRTMTISPRFVPIRFGRYLQ